MTDGDSGGAAKKTPPSFAAMALGFAVMFVPIAVGIDWAWNSIVHEPFDLAKSALGAAITGVLSGILFAWWFRRRAKIR